MTLELNYHGSIGRAALTLIACLVCVEAAHASRVPTKYNDRYQALYAEQELFRNRPELLGCVAFAKDAVQNAAGSPFNKLRYTPQSVQTAYVTEAILEGVGYLNVRIRAEGRIKAYSFLENWENAEINCAIPVSGPPRVSIEIAN
jgi:hypothetical protein